MPLHNNAKKGREESDSDASYAPERELATSRDDPHPTRGRAKPPPQPVDNQGERREDMADFCQSFFQHQRELDDQREERRRAEATQVLQQQFEYQQQLMKLQAEQEVLTRGRQRDETTDRRRKDALAAALPNFKETEDLEDYIFTVEDHFRQCELPRREWVFGLSTRLTGKVASLMSDIRMSTDDYDEVKAKFLKAAGYTPKQAAVKFHHTKF